MKRITKKEFFNQIEPLKDKIFIRYISIKNIKDDKIAQKLYSL
jgi:hypothetical protein